MSKFEVAVGNEFQINAVDVPSASTIKATSDAAVQIEEAKARRRLAYIVVVATVGALFGAAAADCYAGRDSWGAVVAVWGVTGPLCAAVLAYYFGKSR